MDKLHTHYDNLKIARLAPPEVIRAAYKALSQKYHPDKNPGDEKSARIMAILNSAYRTLSDEQRRKEHDEWIAAEEWEIEWLESTRQEENGDGSTTEQSQNRGAGSAELVTYKPSRDPKWWSILAACFAVGWLGSIYTHSSAAISQTNNADASSEQVVADSWAVSKSALSPSVNKTPEIKVVVLSQIRLPKAEGKCADVATEYPRMAPNGEPWPTRSSYIDGYRVGNMGGYTELTVDNSNNGTAVYVKLFDVEKKQNVRHVFVAPYSKFFLERLTAGNYELHRQDIGSAPISQAECNRRMKRAQ